MHISPGLHQNDGQKKNTSKQQPKHKLKSFWLFHYKIFGHACIFYTHCCKTCAISKIIIINKQQQQQQQKQLEWSTNRPTKRTKSCTYQSEYRRYKVIKTCIDSFCYLSVTIGTMTEISTRNSTLLARKWICKSLPLSHLIQWNKRINSNWKRQKVRLVSRYHAFKSRNIHEIECTNAYTPNKTHAYGMVRQKEKEYFWT